MKHMLEVLRENWMQGYCISSIIITWTPYWNDSFLSSYRSTDLALHFVGLLFYISFEHDNNFHGCKTCNVLLRSQMVWNLCYVREINICKHQQILKYNSDSKIISSFDNPLKKRFVVFSFLFLKTLATLLQSLGTPLANQGFNFDFSFRPVNSKD